MLLWKKNKWTIRVYTVSQMNFKNTRLSDKLQKQNSSYYGRLNRSIVIKIQLWLFGGKDKGGEFTTNGYEGTLLGNENFLYLDLDGGYMSAHMCQLIQWHA